MIRWRDAVQKQRRCHNNSFLQKRSDEMDADDGAWGPTVCESKEECPVFAPLLQVVMEHKMLPLKEKCPILLAILDVCVAPSVLASLPRSSSLSDSEMLLVSLVNLCRSLSLWLSRMLSILHPFLSGQHMSLVLLATS